MWPLINIRKEYKSALISGLGGICLSLMLGSLTAYILSVEDRGNLAYYGVVVALIIGPLSFGIPFSNCYFEMKQKAMVKDSFFLPVYLSLVFFASYVVGQAISDIAVVDLIYFSLTSSGYYYVNERCKTTSRLNLFSWFQCLNPLLSVIFILVSLYFSSGLRVFLYVFSTSLSSIAINNVDKLFIVHYLSKAELGIYAVLLTTTTVVTKLSHRIAVSYFVITAGERVTKLRFRAVKFVVATFLPFAILGWGIGKILVPIVFSAKYAGYELISMIAFMTVLLGNASWILSQQFSSSGRPHLNIMRILLSLALFVVLMISEVFGSDLLAVSLAVLCSALLKFLYAIFYTV